MICECIINFFFQVRRRRGAERRNLNKYLNCVLFSYSALRYRSIEQIWSIFTLLSEYIHSTIRVYLLYYQRIFTLLSEYIYSTTRVYLLYYQSIFTLLLEQTYSTIRVDLLYYQSRLTLLIEYIYSTQGVNNSYP